MDCKELDTTDWLNNNNIIIYYINGRTEKNYVIILTNSKEKYFIFTIHLKLKTKIPDKPKIEENFLNSINYTYQKIIVNIKPEGETLETDRRMKCTYTN